jgi:hypothetical protein
MQIRPLTKILAAIVLLFVSLSCGAEGFAFEVASPKFKVSIPGLPQMKMELHPRNATQPHLRYLGADGPYTIAVFTPAAAAGMTPLECAGATVKTLAARPGVPQAPEVYKSRLNDKTFIAIYAVQAAPGVHLHAHLLSAAGKHCIEVHATWISVDEEELAAWVGTLEKASIEPE